MLLLTPSGTPALTMFSDPIEQCAFEPDIITEPFRLEPLVLQDLFPLGEKFLIQTGLFHKLPGRRGLLCRMSHEAGEMRARRRGLSMPAIFRKRHMVR